MCLESGQWEEAACEAVSCPALPDVFQGMYTCTNSLFYDTLCTLRCQDQAENVGINSEGGVLLSSQRVRNLQLGSDPPVLFHAGVRLSSLTDSCCFSPLVLKLLLILFFLKCVSSSLHTQLWLSWSVLNFLVAEKGGGRRCHIHSPSVDGALQEDAPAWNKSRRRDRG